MIPVTYQRALPPNRITYLFPQVAEIVMVFYASNKPATYTVEPTRITRDITHAADWIMKAIDFTRKNAALTNTSVNATANKQIVKHMIVVDMQPSVMFKVLTSCLLGYVYSQMISSTWAVCGIGRCILRNPLESLHISLYPPYSNYVKWLEISRA